MTTVHVQVAVYAIGPQSHLFRGLKNTKIYRNIKQKPISRSEAANLHTKRHCLCRLYWGGENILPRRVIDSANLQTKDPKHALMKRQKN